MFLAIALLGSKASAATLADAFGPLPPADQRCIVDVSVTEGATSIGWRVATRGSDTMAVSTTLAAGKRQAVLQSAGATWFQTEGMGKAMRVGLAQRLLGQLSIGDMVDPRLIAGWQVTGTRADGTLDAVATPGSSSSFAKAEFTLSGGRLATARFYAPSGALVRSAAYTFDATRLTRVDVTDVAHPTRPTVLALGPATCSVVAWTVASDTLMVSALGLLAAP